MLRYVPYRSRGKEKRKKVGRTGDRDKLAIQILPGVKSSDHQYRYD